MNIREDEVVSIASAPRLQRRVMRIAEGRSGRIESIDRKLAGCTRFQSRTSATATREKGILEHHVFILCFQSVHREDGTHKTEKECRKREELTTDN